MITNRKTTGRAAVVALALLAVAGAAGCRKEYEREDPDIQRATAGLPSRVLAATEPPGAKEVAAVKASAKEGDEVVVRGRVGGSSKPIVAGRAVFTLADRNALKACSEKEGDTCGTPWDYCCHSRDEISAATLTVQISDPEGRAIPANVEVSGVKPLAHVIVRGKVGPRPDPKVLVIEAASVFVVK